MENRHITFTLSLLDARMFLRRIYTGLIRLKLCNPKDYVIIKPFVKDFAKSLLFQLKTADSFVIIHVPYAIWGTIAPYSGAGLTQESWKETVRADAIKKVRTEFRRENDRLLKAQSSPPIKRTHIRPLSKTPEYKTLLEVPYLVRA